MGLVGGTSDPSNVTKCNNWLAPGVLLPTRPAQSTGDGCFTDLCFEALTCSVLSAQCLVLSAVRAAFSSVSVHWQAKVGGHSILCNWRSLGGQCILYTPPGRSVSILYTCRRSFYPRGDPGVNSIPWCGILY